MGGSTGRSRRLRPRAYRGLAAGVGPAGRTVLAAPAATSAVAPLSAGAYGISDSMLSLSQDIDKSHQIEAMTDAIEEGIELQREGRREQARIVAPTSRAGYLVALICGLLLFWFMSVYVFAGNKVMIGILIAIIAIATLMSLRTMIEKKGARYVAATHGVVMGLS